MKQAWIASLAPVFLFAATACSEQTEQAPIAGEEATPEEEQGVERLNVEAGELPPMISRSPSYRCTDGDALYVDVLTDGNSVMVRDSRADVPTQLTRSGDDEPFTGDDRSLSGTGREVRYSTPERPDQSCTEADT